MRSKLLSRFISFMTSAPNRSTERSNDPMDDSIRNILTTTHTIAIVGLSDNPERYSNIVARYLQNHGYRIIPVNPNITEVLGEKAYPDLASIPFPVDLVDVFRNTRYASNVVTQAINMKVPVVWLQLGINIPNIQDMTANSSTICIDKCCIKAEHHRLMN